MNEKWTILKTLNWLTSYLEEKEVPEARLSAEYILSHSLGIKRLDLYLQFDKILLDKELQSLKPLIARRVKREPIQHIIGKWGFRNVEVEVNNDALIPRPETEFVVERAINIIKENDLSSLIELGVGSGAILLSLADELPELKLTGVEISEKAYQLAERNLKSCSDRVDLLRGDLYKPVEGKKFDIILSNPPYIPEEILAELEPEVRDHEPKEALVGGKDGLDFYRQILNDAPKYLNTSGWVVLELGDNQKEDVIKIASDTKCFINIEVEQDLSEKDRIFIAQLNGERNG